MSQQHTATAVADLVSSAIERAEERAAARYERALVNLVRQLDPTLEVPQAKAKVRRAWAWAEAEAEL